MYIPYMIKDRDLFRMLAHLVYPGVMFTTRPAAVLAFISWLSGNGSGINDVRKNILTSSLHLILA